MNWDAIGAVGEILGAFGVLATLIYLSIQIRSNTKEVKSENVHRVTDSFNALNLLVASDDHLADLWHKGMVAYEELSDADKARFGFMQLSAFRILDSLYYQIRRGTGDEQLWNTEMDTLNWFFSGEGARAWWRQQQFGFSPEFREYIDNDVIPKAESNDRQP